MINTVFRHKLHFRVVDYAIRIWLIAMLILTASVVGAQNQEDVKSETKEVSKKDAKNKEEIKTHSIKKATIYSAVLPGLGQGYNRKYWKIPIVYVGFGVMTYFIVSNVQEFRKFEEAFIYVANGETYPIDNDYVDRYDQNQLEQGMDNYRRYRDLSIIVTVLWYGLNILDANVDAHFFDYDINDDITLNFKPYQQRNTIPGLSNSQIPETGLRLTLKF